MIHKFFFGAVRTMCHKSEYGAALTVSLPSAGSRDSYIKGVEIWQKVKPFAFQLILRDQRTAAGLNF